MSKVTPYAKALVAALIAGLASLQQALDGDNHVTATEWAAVVMATLVALGAVFAIPNRDPQAEHQEESVQPPQAGVVDLVTVFYVLGILFFALGSLWLLGADTRTWLG